MMSSLPSKAPIVRVASSRGISQLHLRRTTTTTPLSRRPSSSSSAAAPKRTEQDDDPSRREEPRPESASDHLFKLAEEEEAIAGPSRPRSHSQDPSETPWTGDESAKDAVLRMLVDKYKPLRVQGWTKKTQGISDKPLEFPTSTRRRVEDDGDGDGQWLATYKRSGASSQAIDQAQSENRALHPWDFNFVSPVDGQIKVGHYRPLPTTIPPSSTRLDKADRTISARVFRAKEASQDYSQGDREGALSKMATRKRASPVKRRGGGEEGGGGPMPGSIRAWNSLIEEKIERARAKGLFKNLEGKGKPFKIGQEESNPYISRTEFLMNRIVQRQGSAPPWIELQRELEAELDVFRSSIRDSWLRRATRMITLQPLTPSVVESVREYRDPDWEARELAYHNEAISNLNSVLRRYNAVAPYHVRKAPFILSQELESCFRDIAPILHSEIERRFREGPGVRMLRDEGLRGVGGKSGQGTVGGAVEGQGAEEVKAVKESMWKAFRRLVRQVLEDSKGESGRSKEMRA